MLRKTSWAVCSLLVLQSCAKIARPDADWCVTNVPGRKQTCYNIKNDYNDSGQLKPGAQPHYKPMPDLESINKHVIMDPDSFVKLKAYVKLLREEYDRGCKNP